MRSIISLLLLISVSVVTAQERPELIDTKYLEDQFYLGLTYNILLDQPPGVSQRNLSYGLQGGFIRDIPINKERNVGFGIGLGYALNSYYTNLVAVETDSDIIYSIIGRGESFRRSKLETHILEMPIEFRWRTSNAVSHKFWRVYGGLKLGYVFSGRSKLVTDTDKIAFQNEDIREFQYGIILSAGYNTFNFHVYLGLQDLLEKDVVTVDNVPIQFAPLHIGLIFYIL